MIEIFGWCCTLLVLLGFYYNSIKKSIVAAILWIIGDIGWIIYDVIIVNYSHAALSFFIIILNLNLIKNSLMKNKYNQ